MYVLIDVECTMDKWFTSYSSNILDKLKVLIKLSITDHHNPTLLVCTKSENSQMSLATCSLFCQNRSYCFISDTLW